MPDVTGVELCEIVKREYPQTIRMILTGYTDPDSMMEAINKGQVYSFITKPWARETLFPILLRGFEAYELVASNNALSERLDHAERCATLGRCAASIAHEMRNQLFILPLVELIESKYQNHAELMELAAVARLTHERLKELIDEVKTFVRRDETHGQKTARVLLSHLTREAVFLAGLHESIPKRALRLEVLAEPLVCCHKARIQQVVFNLVKNAADALASHPDPRIDITVSQEDSHAVLSVGDNGRGIDPVDLERIWEPFFTTKGAESTGLGLDFCRRTIEALGGTITCQNRPGLGATFVVCLPVVADLQDSACADR
jgi:signal transduction histidine kinase